MTKRESRGRESRERKREIERREKEREMGKIKMCLKIVFNSVLFTFTRHYHLEFSDEGHNDDLPIDKMVAIL
jgi:hypothetical protein